MASNPYASTTYGANAQPAQPNSPQAMEASTVQEQYLDGKYEDQHGNWYILFGGIWHHAIPATHAPHSVTPVHVPAPAERHDMPPLAQGLPPATPALLEPASQASMAGADAPAPMSLFDLSDTPTYNRLFGKGKRRATDITEDVEHAEQSTPATKKARLHGGAAMSRAASSDESSDTPLSSQDPSLGASDTSTAVQRLTARPIQRLRALAPAPEVQQVPVQLASQAPSTTAGPLQMPGVLAWNGTGSASRPYPTQADPLPGQIRIPAPSNGKDRDRVGRRRWDNLALFRQLGDQKIFAGALNPIDINGAGLDDLADRYTNTDLNRFINVLWVRLGERERDMSNTTHTISAVRKEYAKRMGISEEEAWKRRNQAREANQVNFTKTAPGRFSNGSMKDPEWQPRAKGSTVRRSKSSAITTPSTQQDSGSSADAGSHPVQQDQNVVNQDFASPLHDLQQDAGLDLAPFPPGYSWVPQTQQEDQHLEFGHQMMPGEPYQYQPYFGNYGMPGLYAEATSDVQEHVQEGEQGALDEDSAPGTNVADMGATLPFNGGNGTVASFDSDDAQGGASADGDAVEDAAGDSHGSESTPADDSADFTSLGEGILDLDTLWNNFPMEELQAMGGGFNTEF